MSIKSWEKDIMAPKNKRQTQFFDQLKTIDKFTYFCEHLYVAHVLFTNPLQFEPNVHKIQAAIFVFQVAISNA